MPEKMYHIACTRPLDENHWLEAQGHGILIESYPFLEMQPLPAAEISRCIAAGGSLPLVFTSQHAVLALRNLAEERPEALMSRQCFCIEGATRSLAARSGFEVVATAPDAANLAREIIRHGCREVLHCTSALRREELYEVLEGAGIQVKSCEVYRKMLQPWQVKAHDGILFFSPSQVQAFMEANELQAQIPVFCIGPTTAASLKALGHKVVFTAPRPDTESLLQLIYDYFKTTLETC
jgi:uroporphyrinogen-III synthase